MKMNKKLKFMLAASSAILVTGATIPAIVSCSSSSDDLNKNLTKSDYLSTLNKGLNKLYNPRVDNIIPEGKKIEKEFNIKDALFTINENNGSTNTAPNQTVSLASVYGNDIGSSDYVNHPPYSPELMYKKTSKLNPKFVLDNISVLFDDKKIQQSTKLEDIETRTFIPKNTNPAKPNLILEIVLKTDLNNPQTYYFSFTGFNDASLETNLVAYLNYVYNKLVTWYIFNPLFYLNAYVPVMWDNSGMYEITKQMSVSLNSRMIVEAKLDLTNQSLSDELKNSFIKHFYSKDIINRLIKLINEYDTYLYSLTSGNASDGQHAIKIPTVILTEDQINKINLDFFDFTFTESNNMKFQIQSYLPERYFNPTNGLVYKTKPKQLCFKFNENINQILSIPKSKEELNKITSTQNDNSPANLILTENSSIVKTINDQEFLNLINQALEGIYQDLITHNELTITGNQYEISADKVSWNNNTKIIPIDYFDINPSSSGNNPYFNFNNCISILIGFLFTQNQSLQNPFDYSQFSFDVNSSNKVVLNYKDLKKETKFVVTKYNNKNAIEMNELIKKYAEQINQKLANKTIQLNKKQITRITNEPIVRRYNESPNINLDISEYISSVIFKNKDEHWQFNLNFMNQIEQSFSYYFYNCNLTDIFDNNWKINSYSTLSGVNFNLFTYNPKTNKIGIVYGLPGLESCEFNIKVQLV